MVFDNQIVVGVVIVDGCGLGAVDGDRDAQLQQTTLVLLLCAGCLLLFVMDDETKSWIRTQTIKSFSRQDPVVDIVSHE
jgi:hypothetical protein